MLCLKCKVRLKTVRIGAFLHSGNGVGVSADVKECPTCSARVAVPAATGFTISADKLATARERMGEWFIDLPQGG